MINPIDSAGVHFMLPLKKEDQRKLRNVFHAAMQSDSVRFPGKIDVRSRTYSIVTKN